MKAMYSQVTYCLVFFFSTQNHSFNFIAYGQLSFFLTQYLPHNICTISATISACLHDIFIWMKDRHLQLNQAKKELLGFPAKLRSPPDQYPFRLTQAPRTPLKNAPIISDRLAPLSFTPLFYSLALAHVKKLFCTSQIP